MFKIAFILFLRVKIIFVTVLSSVDQRHIATSLAVFFISVHKIEDTADGIFGIEISGEISEQNLKTMDVQMRDYKRKHGNFNFLAVVHEYDYASITAMWKDFKAGLKYFGSIDKAALVSDVDWVEDAVKVLGPIAPDLKTKTFNTDEREKAVTWLTSEEAVPLAEASSPSQPHFRSNLATAAGKRPEVVVITGASGGVGRTTAWRFAESGAYIFLIARGEEALEATKNEVEARGGKAWVYIADVADAQKMKDAAAFAEEHIGAIDVWINNAMVSVFSKVSEMQSEEYRRVTEVTYLGQVYGTLAALEHMRPRNRGKIILVGSALAYRGIPLQSAYCGSKHAIQGFFESLRAELFHEGSKIGLSIVHLPAMNTTQFGWVKSRMDRKPKPMGAIFEPEVASQAIFEVAHEDVRERMVAFSTVKTVWGNRLVPEYLDHYMAEHGFEGQLTEVPEDPNRKNNLWEPVPGNHGAHGDFGAQALEYSVFNRVTKHKEIWGAIGLIAGGFLLWGALRDKNNSDDTLISNGHRTRFPSKRHNPMGSTMNAKEVMPYRKFHFL
ncbi:SDR family oxidoreductase [Pricia sp. S334]|uniref:SDR family oxidoreductase n=1 Tax=Pricia mediterranea TaxID=3076079 RepID=A0ABU3L1I1_9FLAO|nr:SDR family oxidoreductase [Pricia sp. S334]MDT7827576.1 SDR family oxidoreductase [Pricia sp. S334]